jgi:hypothetical protein
MLIAEGKVECEATNRFTVSATFLVRHKEKDTRIS